ncbi:hypothetical protein [Staphylococcus schweitzeri]|uniref:hypothetical protein n=1 Tax=Staphylococcus schweitzeri TaxID=1654388 RepID=UPI000503625B|nr:hypothetical protein [Staphylococcus schweitzeri]CDR51764.1 hypothetical protein ERS140159_01722 [Staphylococcus schweitzeri]
MDIDKNIKFISNIYKKEIEKITIFYFILAPTMIIISYFIVENSDKQLKTIFPILITITNLLIGNYFSKSYSKRYNYYLYTVENSYEIYKNKFYSHKLEQLNKYYLTKLEHAGYHLSIVIIGFSFFPYFKFLPIPLKVLLGSIIFIFFIFMLNKILVNEFSTKIHRTNNIVVLILYKILFIDNSQRKRHSRRLKIYLRLFIKFKRPYNLKYLNSTSMLIFHLTFMRFIILVIRMLFVFSIILVSFALASFIVIIIMKIFNIN